MGFGSSSPIYTTKVKTACFLCNALCHMSLSPVASVFVVAFPLSANPLPPASTPTAFCSWSLQKILSPPGSTGPSYRMEIRILHRNQPLQHRSRQYRRQLRLTNFTYHHHFTPTLTCMVSHFLQDYWRHSNVRHPSNLLKLHHKTYRLRRL